MTHNEHTRELLIQELDINVVVEGELMTLTPKEYLVMRNDLDNKFED